MPITIEQHIHQEGAGFYYTDAINWEEGQGTLTCEKIVWTEEAGEIDTWVYQHRAKNLRSKLVIIKGKL